MHKAQAEMKWRVIAATAATAAASADAFAQLTIFRPSHWLNPVCHKRVHSLGTNTALKMVEKGQREREREELLAKREKVLQDMQGVLEVCLSYAAVFPRIITWHR